MKKINKTHKWRLVNRSIVLLFGILGCQSIKADVTVEDAAVNFNTARIQAGLFLSQATMGYSITALDDLAARIGAIGETNAYNEWLDREFNIPMASFVDYVDNVIAIDGFDDEEDSSVNPILLAGIGSYQTYTWWDRVTRGEDHLRQRMTWALSQIFVTSSNVDEGRLAARWKQPLYYYDILQENAFGNYRELLEDVTYHPFMGFFLSHLRNAKGDEELGVFADENYAREVLQLFSIGVFRLSVDGSLILDDDGELIPNYSNDDIRGLAKVFTGLGYAEPDGSAAPATGNNYFFNQRNYEYPMRMTEGLHDTTSKTFLGTTLDANQSGDVDISQALDTISSHINVSPFMAHRLIQRFTSSNPSSAYIARVSDAWRNGGEGNGDLKSTIRAILLDPEARDSLVFNNVQLANGMTRIEVRSKDPLHGRLKEPVIQLAQVFNRFEPISDEPNGVFKPFNLSSITEQTVMRPPSVFNYYNADFQPGDGPLAEAAIANNEELTMPEAELLPNSLIPMFDGFLNLARSGETGQVATIFSNPAVLQQLNEDREESLSLSALPVIERLNIFLCNGMMPDSLKTEIADIMENDSGGRTDERFARIFAIILNSADFAVTN